MHHHSLTPVILLTVAAIAVAALISAIVGTQEMK